MKEASEDLRVALVMFKTNVNRETAERALNKTNFVVEKAIKIIN